MIATQDDHTVGAHSTMSLTLATTSSVKSAPIMRECLRFLFISSYFKKRTFLIFSVRPPTLKMVKRVMLPSTYLFQKECPSLQMCLP